MACLFLLTILAIVTMVYITPYGIGMVNDSVGYIGGARNILVGHGYSRLTGNYTTVPITNYPPFYSIVLAGVGLLGIDAIQAAWGLSLALFSLTMILMVWMARYITRNDWMALFAGCVFIISAPFLHSYAFAMSEPLYLVLTLLALRLGAVAVERNRWYWFALSGFLAGLSFITRYVGLALFGTVILGLLIFKSNWKTKLTSSAIYLVSGLLPVLAWLIRNWMVTKNAANRSFLWHPIGQDKIHEGVLNFWGWLLPDYGQVYDRAWEAFAVLFVVLCLGLAFAAFQNWKNVRIETQGLERQPKILTWMVLVHTLVYFGVLIFSLTFVDASPIFEDRILAPFMMGLVILLSVLCAWLWNKQRRVLRILVGVGVAVFLIFLAEDTIDFLKEYHRDGQGFASLTWRDSETILEVERLPEATLYSNRITATYILTGRPAYILPTATNPATGLARPEYQEDLNAIRQTILDGRGYLVVFGYEELLSDPEQKQMLEELTAGLPVEKQTADGIIFGKTLAE